MGRVNRIPNGTENKKPGWICNKNQQWIDLKDRLNWLSEIEQGCEKGYQERIPHCIERGVPVIYD